MIERFWIKVDRRRRHECWPWLRGKDARGYGKFSIGGVPRLAHRVAYELLIGPIPDGLVLDHLCRRHWCVNPWHTEPVTQGENVRRGLTGQHFRRRRDETDCAHGHVIDGIDRRGRRYCKTCKLERQRERRAAARQL